MDQLNHDEFFLITKFLKLGDLLAISETSRHLQKMSDNPYVWKYFLQKDFPEYQRLGLPPQKETYRLLCKLFQLNKIIGSSDDFYELYIIDNLEFTRGQSMTQIVIKKLDILSNLKSLYMIDNQIIGFPTKMNNLKKLYLDLNQIKKFPEEICQMTDLEILSLNRNKIKTLPKEIGQLTNLQELSLNNNKIRLLPVEIGKLTNLRELSLEGNKMSVLPQVIGKLTALEILNLSWNRFDYIPIEMNQLINLTDLDLDCNYMSVIPKEFDNLSEFFISSSRV